MRKIEKIEKKRMREKMNDSAETEDILTCPLPHFLQVLQALTSTLPPTGWSLPCHMPASGLKPGQQGWQPSIIALCYQGPKLLCKLLPSIRLKSKEMRPIHKQLLSDTCIRQVLWWPDALKQLQQLWQLFHLCWPNLLFPKQCRSWQDGS